MTQRLEELLDEVPATSQRNQRAARATAAALLAVLVTLGLSAPAWSLGSARPATGPDYHACSHAS